MSVVGCSIQSRDSKVRDQIHHHARGEIMGNNIDPVDEIRTVVRELTRRCLWGWCDGAAFGAAIAVVSLRFDAEFADWVASQDNPLVEALMFTGILANIFGAFVFMMAFLYGAWKYGG